MLKENIKNKVQSQVSQIEVKYRKSKSSTANRSQVPQIEVKYRKSKSSTANRN